MAFDYFVLLAEMRTGSNLLESNLNAFDGMTCHGELFNPSFICNPGTEDYAGVSMAERDADPWRLLNEVRSGGGRMVGFRLFHDHDPRIWQHVMGDRACAKIILTRNPIESYVSRKIAKQTGQWQLGDVKHRKKSLAHFDGEEFERHIEKLQATQMQILNTLQTTGQSAYYIGYEDANDLNVLNGLARWLGMPSQITDLPRKFKKQNPESLEAKLSNPEALAPALARIDRFDLGRTPNFEPRRGPMLDACVAGAKTSLFFMPMRGAPEGEIANWLAALDGVEADDLARGFDQPRFEAWRREHPGFHSFTVVSHPLKRAYRAFCKKVITNQLEPVREHMNRLFAAELPEGNVSLGPLDQRAAFKSFLRFAAASLSGQTGLQPWPIWASQSANLQGYATVVAPDFVFREEDMGNDLPWLARKHGHAAPSAPVVDVAENGPTLSQIVDDEVLDLVRIAYRRDFEQFGYTLEL